MERLAALEAEVKADADAQRARKAAALAKLRDQRVMQTAGGAPVVRNRATPADEAAVRRRSHVPELGEPELGEDDGRGADRLEDLGGALELASKANRVKQELARKPRKGEKNWMISGGASLVLGPIGWLYAGSMREAVPATAGWLVLAALVSKILPVFLIMPVLMVVLPLSAIAGVVYAMQYNRTGKRQRLFSDKKDKAKALPAVSARARGQRGKLRDGS